MMPLCQRCGFEKLPSHKCDLQGFNVTTGSFVQGIYMDARTGIVQQWALVLDCALNGCDLPHTDNGEFYCVSTASGDVSPNTIRRNINGHACRLVRRFVVLREWENADADKAEHTKGEA
jgi:hypothetical protein